MYTSQYTRRHTHSYLIPSPSSVKDQQEDPSRPPFPSGPCPALTHTQSDSQGAAGVEDPSVYLQLEEPKGA